MAASRRPSVFLFSCRVAYLGSAATKVQGHSGGSGISDHDSAFGALQEPLTTLYDGDAGTGEARAPRGAIVTVFSTGLQLEVNSDQTSRIFFWFSVDRLLLAAAVKRTVTTPAAAKAKSGSWRRPRGLRRRVDDAPAFAAVDAPESAVSRHPALLALLVAGCDEDTMTMATAKSAATKRRGLTRRPWSARSTPPQCHGLVLASETQARLLEAACRFALVHRYALADEVHALWQEAVSGLASAGVTASSSSASSSPLVGAAGPSTRGAERSDALLASEASDASLSGSSSSSSGHPGRGDDAVTQSPHPTHWSLADEYVPSVRIRGNHFNAAAFDGFRNVSIDRRPLREWSSVHDGDGMTDRQWPSALRRSDRPQERPPEADGWHSGSRRMDVQSVRSTARAEATIAKTAEASTRWRHSRYIDAGDEDDGFRISSDVRRRRARSEAGNSGRHQHPHHRRAPSIESPRRRAEAEAAVEVEALFVNAAANGVAMGFVTEGGIPRVAKGRQPASGGDGSRELRHDRPARSDGVASSRAVSEIARRSTLAAPAQAASEPVLASRNRPRTPPADYYDELSAAVAEHRLQPPPVRAERGSLRRTTLDVRSSSYSFGYAESEATSERVAAMSIGGQRRPRENPPVPPLLPPPPFVGTASKLVTGTQPPPPPPPPPPPLPPPNAGIPDRERELTEQRNELMRSIRERVRERASVARPQATE